MTDLTFDWSASMLEGIRQDDATESKIVIRTAERLVAKGAELSHYEEVQGVREGFNWGRSSHGVRTCKVWTILFTMPGSEAEHAVTIVVQKVSYTKCNPYDRAPKGSGESYRVQATDATKAALGWKAQG